MEISELWGPVSGGVGLIAEDLSVCTRVDVCECECMQSQAGNRSIPLLSRALRLSPLCSGWYIPGQRALRALIHQMMYCSNANTLERSSCAMFNTPSYTDYGFVTHTYCWLFFQIKDTSALYSIYSVYIHYIHTIYYIYTLPQITGLGLSLSVCCFAVLLTDFINTPLSVLKCFGPCNVNHSLGRAAERHTGSWQKLAHTGVKWTASAHSWMRHPWKYCLKSLNFSQ